jgi:TctA family transporter
LVVKHTYLNFFLLGKGNELMTITQISSCYTIMVTFSFAMIFFTLFKPQNVKKNYNHVKMRLQIKQLLLLQPDAVYYV